MTSLNPVFTIGDQIAEVLILHEGMSKQAALAEAKRLLDMVRLPDAVEEGPVADIFARPQHPYTQTLLAAVPKLGSMTGEAYPKRLPLTVMDGDTPRLVGGEHVQDTARYGLPPILSVRDLVTRFNIKKGIFGGVTHRVHAKETSGTILFGGRPVSSMNGTERQKLRQEIQYIFQDPFASLDPRKTVGFSIAEPIRTHALIDGSKPIQKRVDELLERVGLTSAH
eukprot:gene21018-24979_t